ncbi:4Fe-4S dicluster domain-containing protein [uncultured Clostridium sp.]|uniref:4Fe-4S dicluster domain-containing protein n=1 Tax=uncultured Clostridium sp. TaxID=59620 RepID=UPI0025D81C9A|nr:selenate reductase [uncultured Clostridium sp.]
MGDKMMPISFEKLLKKLLREYKESTTFMGVPVNKTNNNVPLGPAAGPHTQLAGNIVAAYGQGASYFELKTVQILEGKELNIKKPCIYVKNEVFNTEWSSELTVEEAQNEYIKAYLLIKILSKELNIREEQSIHFIMSIGYDLSGIKSQKIDTFLGNMKNAENTCEWKRDIKYIQENIDLFSNFKLEDLKNISSEISSTVTLSTMHGCRSEEIEKIALYLINDKKLNVYIKMNPTLAGKEKIQEILKKKGYENIHFNEEIFEKDIDLEHAFKILMSVKRAAEKQKREFGVKLTNTFPVKIEENELNGKEMYMSGPALYPISIYVASKLAEMFNGDILISYSGGADVFNIKEILNTGIKPVTVSTVLLKSGGYKNISRLIEKASPYTSKENIDIKALKELAQDAEENIKYDNKEIKQRKYSIEYDFLCAKCNNCVDVCPNRANIKVTTDEGSYVLHRDSLCNECGCCSSACAMGHVPYKEKLTFYEDKEEFEDGNNVRVLYMDEKKKYVENGHKQEIPKKIEKIIETAYRKGCL